MINILTTWQEFESNAFLYLEKKYSKPNIDFSLLGESNSNQSDVLVTKNEKELFFIEIKSPESQAGQFALSKNPQNNWEFSNLNRTIPTKNSTEIINDLNTSDVKNITTSQTFLNTSKDILFNWIKDFYSQRNVKYILTKFNNQYVIAPINKIENYFNIKGSVRKKGSGSSDVSNPFWEKIKKHYIFNGVNDVKVISGKRYLTYNEIPNQLTSKKNIIKDFIDDEVIRIQLEVLNDNKVYIRKLSTTSNPTVIFSLISKRKQIKSDLDEFNISIS